MGGSELTHRVPGHSSRNNTPGLPQTEQRHLDGEQRRLSELRPVQHRRVLPEDHLLEGAGGVAVQGGQNLVERHAERGRGLVQPTPHPQALAPLPGEQHRKALPARGVRDRTGGRTAFGQAAQGHHRVGRGGGEDGGAVVEVGAVMGGGSGHGG
nr:hypothetical protein [Streptomyces sp. NRRL WC-3742]